MMMLNSMREELARLKTKIANGEIGRNTVQTAQVLERTIKDLEAIEDLSDCQWCGEYGEVYHTDLGMLCDRCICAIRNRGDDVSVGRK